MQGSVGKSSGPHGFSISPAGPQEFLVSSFDHTLFSVLFSGCLSTPLVKSSSRGLFADDCPPGFLWLYSWVSIIWWVDGWIKTLQPLEKTEPWRSHKMHVHIRIASKRWTMPLKQGPAWSEISQNNLIPSHVCGKQDLVLIDLRVIQIHPKWHE